MTSHGEWPEDHIPTHDEQSEGEQDLSPEDQAFWASLTPWMSPTKQPALCFSEETVEALRRICPPVELSADAMACFEDIFQRTTSDIEFEAAVKAATRRATLGEYLFFLRQQTGHTVADVAQKTDLDFQTLTDLEQDNIRPQRIPPHPLAALVRWLNGSLEQLERLLLTTVKESHFISSSGRESLYRKTHRASRPAIEPASLSVSGPMEERMENPEYKNELQAVRQLVLDVRAAWGNSASSQDNE